MFKNTKAFSSFSVNDIAKAKDFYTNILGLDVKEEYGGLTLNIAGSNSIMVYPKDNHEPATFTVLNFPVEDIEKSVDELIAKGITFEQYDFLNTNEKGIAKMPEEGGANGPTMAWFTDPAGNIFSLMQEK